MDKLLKFNNKLIKSGNNIICKKNIVDPYNPLGLPYNTLRAKFVDGYTPTMGTTQTLVDGVENVWDIYAQSNDWSKLYNGCYGNILQVLGANTSNVTKMYWTFYACSSISSMPLFDTSNVTDMDYLLAYCYSLTSVPLYDTSKVTNMDRMLYNCKNVQSGALAMYQQASTQASPPVQHYACFRNCGSDTQTGSAELAQIPSDWK